MRNIIFALIVVALGVGVWYWWGQDAVENATSSTEEVEQVNGSANTYPEVSATTMEPGTYTADTAASTIEWEAGKPAISGYVHHGTFSLQSGTATLSEGNLSGQFVVDMNSLKVTSLGGGKAGQESALEGHLKGERFFNVMTHPTATFSITSVEPQVFPGPDQSDYTATGELTMKGQTKTVTFPIKVIVGSENEVFMTATVPLDRTEWDITFGSARFVEAITDQVIGDTVGLTIGLVLRK